MGKLGTRWEIGGVGAAFITRGGVNGRYCITFERELASLEQIEEIDWANPVSRQLTDSQEELGLPEGYGFDLVDIRYDHGAKIFVAEVKTAQQYLGDVTGYQTQLAQLEQVVAQQSAQMEAHAAETAAMFNNMETAYQEGVESNG